MVPLHGYAVGAHHFSSGGALDADGNRGALVCILIKVLEVVLDRLSAAVGLTEHRKEVHVFNPFRAAPEKLATSPVGKFDVAVDIGHHDRRLQGVEQRE